MTFIGFKEALYLKRHLQEVKHVTVNPNGSDVLRIHMIPPRWSLNKSIPSVIVVNGQDIVPINLSWAILLSSFIDEITPYDGKEIKGSDWESIVGKSIKRVKRVYLTVKVQTLKDDLWTIINTLTSIAHGTTPEADIGQISIGDYAEHMTAPHRMDLMISSMAKNDGWNCNQKCLHCYAAGQKLAEAAELPTHSWKEIIDKCRKAGIPQLTFTGGEPTLRDDLVELVEHSKWFITRLNTNGVCLSPELCHKLAEASLDSVQVTLYSADPAKHNALVGADNWESTITGIKNAVSAQLNLSINTPLCTINSDYVETLKLAHGLGIQYISCSGLILTGSACGEESAATQLTSGELYGILKDAFAYCKEHSMDISFTSPGWLSAEQLDGIGFISKPTCGACLSNMAIAPDGKVIPCQSWLSQDALGNMLTDRWEAIWDSPNCQRIRKESSKLEQKCQLRVEVKVNP
jgi:MoaA/NifB/PqqE/SkfB family radical SAM enzyme